MLVFSPWMGTSDVLPGAVGSGGEVMSWLCLYSSSGCEGSTLTGWNAVSIYQRFGTRHAYGGPAQVRVRDSELQPHQQPARRV